MDAAGTRRDRRQTSEVQGPARHLRLAAARQWPLPPHSCPRPCPPHSDSLSSRDLVSSSFRKQVSSVWSLVFSGAREISYWKPHPPPLTPASCLLGPPSRFSHWCRVSGATLGCGNQEVPSLGFPSPGLQGFIHKHCGAPTGGWGHSSEQPGLLPVERDRHPTAQMYQWYPSDRDKPGRKAKASRLVDGKEVGKGRAEERLKEGDDEPPRSLGTSTQGRGKVPGCLWTRVCSGIGGGGLGEEHVGPQGHRADLAFSLSVIDTMAEHL